MNYAICSEVNLGTAYFKNPLGLINVSLFVPENLYTYHLSIKDRTITLSSETELIEINGVWEFVSSCYACEMRGFVKNIKSTNSQNLRLIAWDNEEFLWKAISKTVLNEPSEMGFKEVRVILIEEKGIDG